MSKLDTQNERTYSEVTRIQCLAVYQVRFWEFDITSSQLVLTTLQMRCYFYFQKRKWKHWDREIIHKGNKVIKYERKTKRHYQRGSSSTIWLLEIGGTLKEQKAPLLTEIMNEKFSRNDRKNLVTHRSFNKHVLSADYVSGTFQTPGIQSRTNS